MKDSYNILYVVALLFLLLPSCCDIKMLEIHPGERWAFYLNRMVSQIK